MVLCLFANNNMINHAENQMIDHNEKLTAVYLAGVMRKGENEVGLLGFLQKCKNLHSDSTVRVELELQCDILVLVAVTLHLK